MDSNSLLSTMDPDSIQDSTDSPYPTAMMQEPDCRYYYGFNPFIQFILNVCVVLTSILSIITFALARKFNATFVILMAMAGIMTVSTVGLVIANNIGYSVSKIMYQVLAILYSTDSWLMVLLVMFRFFATRSTSGLGDGWRSGRRALIGIGIVSGMSFVVILPVIVIMIKGIFHTYYDTLVRTFVSVSVPGLMMLCFGGALLLNYCTPPGHIMDSEKGRSYGTVAQTGADAAGHQAKDSEVERELTRTALVIALLNGIIYTPGGIVFYLGLTSNNASCGIALATVVFGWITMVLPMINFFLYLLLLSDFRAVYLRCCGRRM